MKDVEKKKDASSLKIKLLTAACIVLAITVVVLLIVLWNNTSDEKGSVQIVEQTKGEQTTKLPNESTSQMLDSQLGEDRQELVIYGTQEQADVILVQTSYGDLKYPYAYSDLIEVCVLNDVGLRALDFSARLPSGTYRIYTIYFYNSEGMQIGTLQLPPDQQPQPVSVLFHGAPDTLEEDDLRSFQAAQDTFTEVWLSLAENEAFTPIESN